MGVVMTLYKLEQGLVCDAIEHFALGFFCAQSNSSERALREIALRIQVLVLQLIVIDFGKKLKSLFLCSGLYVFVC